MRQVRRGLRIEVLLLLVFGAVVALGLPVVTVSFVTYQFALVAIYMIALIGVNLLTGYSGQISLGNGAFMAVGGYVTAILVSLTGVSYLATIPVAALLAGVAGFLFGIPALRLSGIYLALGTFALALATPSVIKNYGQLTGGHEGINIPPAEPPFGIELSGEQWLYYLSAVLAAVLLWFAWNLARSRTGRAFKALREGETAAVASGISIPYYKTLAFAISAFYAGVAGSLLALANAFVNPDSFELGLSLALLAGAVVGGLGTTWGPLFGALFVVWVPYYAQKVLNAKPDIAYGLLLILIIFLMPSGVVGLLNRGWAWYLARRERGRGQEPVEPSPVVGGRT
jgi:branched-chain amino acid transport system permease protein